MNRFITRNTLFLFALLAALSTSGCNTVHGFGEDVKDLGGAIAGDKKPAAKTTTKNTESKNSKKTTEK